MISKVKQNIENSVKELNIISISSTVYELFAAIYLISSPKSAKRVTIAINAI